MNQEGSFKEIIIELIGSFLSCFIIQYANINQSIFSDSIINNALTNSLLIIALIALFFPHAKCYFTPLLTLTSIIY